jgi:elongator complex protein 3 (tRNA carboxymethyluridine synthase)
MLSGVHVVTVAMMPSSCPHGTCVYCPGGIREGTPQSYILDSPVIRTAIPLAYHPYLQVHSRIASYLRMGHDPSKIELIIIGGTFSAYPQEYQEWFVTQCFEALNRFPNPEPPAIASLANSQSRNETADLRCVGMTVETRPDQAGQTQANQMLSYGATRVEMGVQTIRDSILRQAGRAHTAEDVAIATQTLRDSGFKICYHMMLGLPGMYPDAEIEAFESIFEESQFKPDMLKIYPTLVLKGTGLFNLWKTGRYSPYSDDQIVELILEIKRRVPRWLRINRIQREIPSKDTVGGLSTVNLRDLIDRRFRDTSVSCQCIRCREIGHAKLKGIEDRGDLTTFRLCREDYEASNGVEIFLSFENHSKKVLAGFLRLRIPSSDAKRPEFAEPTAIVRELHIYGSAVPIGKLLEDGTQHKGYGSALLSEAETVAHAEFGCKQMAIISGVGVRTYYVKHGYSRLHRSPYMLKQLTS